MNIQKSTAALYLVMGFFVAVSLVGFAMEFEQHFTGAPASVQAK